MTVRAARDGAPRDGVERVGARPLVLIAELTHRCPLRCAYCSNPRALVRAPAELDAAAWARALAEAAELGVLQAHLSGGEPLVREDLPSIARAAAGAGLYATLVTSALGAGDEAACHERLAAVVDAGVRAVQVSFQDTRAEPALAIAGREALARKLGFAREVRRLGASLTANFVLHRANLARLPEFIELALELGADRVELAHAQYHGWAAHNRLALLPTRAQIAEARRVVAAATRRYAAAIELVHVMPDLHADRARACMGGWGRRAIVIDPEGDVLPCHAGKSLLCSLGVELDRVGERSLADIWATGAAFELFRGEAWMEEPCRSCPERGRDFGGCRCQALALSGRATAPDPACGHAPEHARIVALRRRAELDRPRAWALRTFAANREPNPTPTPNSNGDR